MKYRVKKRKKLKNIILLLFLLIISIILLFTYKYYKNKNNKPLIEQLNKYNYSVNAFNKMKNNDLLDKLNKYSKTLEEVLLNSTFKEEYFEDYLRIIYQDKNNFIENINILLNKGYKGNEINNVYIMNDSNINELLKIDYIDITDYYKLSNFNVKNYTRYNNYKNKNNFTIDKIVTYVNNNLDYEFYTQDQEIKEPHDPLVLVNKYNYLSKNYVPKNLVCLFNNSKVKMVNDAAKAYQLLVKAALEDVNLSLCATSAYRDYNWQKSLYNGYVAKNGKAKADTYSARPGYSEHQTGLAVDLMNTDNYGTNKRLNASDFEWLKENSYKYGFIIRYPENKTFITGYINESWHLRYLGIDIATDIVNKDLTFEEYYDLYIKKS